MQRRFPLRCLIASLALALLAPASLAHAGVIYDSLSSSIDGDQAIGIYLPYASFSTGAGGGSLVDVKVNLRPGASMVNPTTVGLYSDNSTSPGSLLAAIGTVDVQALVDPGSNLLDFPLTTPFALTANTRYWIGLSSPGTSTPSWNYSQSASGIGVSGEYIHVGSLSQTVPTSTAAYLMSVEVAPVPEIDPAGLGSVMALVTGALGLVERRRRPVA